MSNHVSTLMNSAASGLTSLWEAMVKELPAGWYGVAAIIALGGWAIAMVMLFTK